MIQQMLLAVAQYLLRDTFTGANGTALTSHTMDVGSGWSYLGAASADIQSNALRVAHGSNPSRSLVVADAGRADATVRATIRSLMTNDYGGLAFRVTNNTNYWVAEYKGDDPTVYLTEVSGGTFTSRGTASHTWTTGDTITIVCSGASIVVKVNGVTAISYGSAATGLSATLYGFENSTNNVTDNGTWDNFEVMP